MIKAIAEREKFPTPTFFRYAAFATAVMLPAHIVATLVFVLLER
jgi:Putative citrate transport